MNLQFVNSVPQLSAAFAELSDSQILSAYAGGVCNRARTEFNIAWADKYFRIDGNMDAILSNYSVTVPQHFTSNVSPTISGLEFDDVAGHTVQLTFYTEELEPYTEDVMPLAWVINTTQLADANTPHFDISAIGNAESRVTTNLLTGEVEEIEGGNYVEWLNSWIPGTTEDYTNAGKAEEVRFRYSKADGSLLSTKLYTTTRNLLFSSDGTLINSDKYEVCLSQQRGDQEDSLHFIDRTNIIDEFDNQDICALHQDFDSRNNSDNNYMRFMTIDPAPEIEEEEPEQFAYASIIVRNIEGISNVEIELLNDESLSVQRLRNNYSNGHIGEWYTANSALDIQP